MSWKAFPNPRARIAQSDDGRFIIEMPAEMQHRLVMMSAAWAFDVHGNTIRPANDEEIAGFKSVHPEEGIA